MRLESQVVLPDLLECMVADDPERALCLRPSTARASDHVQRGGQASIVEGGHSSLRFRVGD